MNTSSDTITDTQIIKRDGTLSRWDQRRVIRAIALALYHQRKGTPNPERGTNAAPFGLSEGDFAITTAIAERVHGRVSKQTNPTVEDVQNAIEIELVGAGEMETARLFMEYRQSHAANRPRKHGDSGMQDFVGVMKYCRYSAELGRRENWAEAAQRVEQMHVRRFSGKVAHFSDEQHVANTINRLISSGDITEQAVRDSGGFQSLANEIRTAFQLVADKKVLPSMRSMQFGGEAIEKNHARMFNCSFSPINRPEAFGEYFWLLLAGCGVGFSVQKRHISKLPALAPRPSAEVELKVEHFIVPDTVEGWAQAFDKLMDSYFNGYKVEFAYHLIRGRGEKLKTSGGIAPGHVPLKGALDAADGILRRAAGRSLRPIEVYDVLMHIAKAVLSGGIRRSATICLFDADDDEMAAAKTGDWFSTNPQRSASNNSAVLLRGKATRAQFDKLFAAQKAYGEPGFYFSDDPDYGPNPCVEITLNPRLTVTPAVLQKLMAYGYSKEVNVGDHLYGFQMCNLSTIAGSAATTPEKFFQLVKSAALIGTLQADYTDNMPFLGPVTRILNEREALIGVSICGIMDNRKVMLDAETLRRGAAVVKATNAIFAAVLGINRAARTTCCKPEGTSSLVLNSGSGIAPHHSRRYFRRVQGSSNDPVVKWFMHHNPHMVEQSAYDATGATVFVTFPVEGPINGVYKDDLNALRHLEAVKLVQENWVQEGRANIAFTDAHHNVSNTINVDDGDWDQVAEFIWDNRHLFTGVALLANSADKLYKQAPREAVSTLADIQKWNSLVYKPVDYRLIPEKEDETAGHAERGAAVACAGGQCSLV